MGTSRTPLSFFSFSLLFTLLSTHALASKKSYIVYLGAHSHGPLATSADYQKVTQSHHDFLASFLGSKEKAKEALFYSYTRHINGFSANMEEEEAVEISKHPDVVSVFLNKGKKLHTTRSWEFLGLEKNGVIPKSSLMYRAKFGRDVIIANLDTGVWPKSTSFNDGGLGPVPSKWKGSCQTNTPTPVKCNRKLIGAKMYYKGYRAYAESLNITVDPSTFTPRDTMGHGSHTLSTAGGRMVPASIYGHANGTAKGGSPDARVAAYKVCWPPIAGGECYDSDILAGFDAAIHDGVDVINLSLGGDPVDYLNDGIAIGSFHAISNGITVVASAGNSGPEVGTVSNVAPWLFTVGASTIDRRFKSDVYLGNKKHYNGVSLAQHSLPEKKFYPLINAADAAAANATASKASQCSPGSLDPAKVKGRIVVCTRSEIARVLKGYVVRHAGGAGMILANNPRNGDDVEADIHFLPATHINANDSAAVFSYIKSTKSPKAYIEPVLTKFDQRPAPSMAIFSSVGPNKISPGILKPDITAPGVYILAAYSEMQSPTELPFDNRHVPFILMSGTSMSSPHVAGIAGLLKSLHPNWSSAAIRSAIMTSGDNMGEPIIGREPAAEATPFNYGAGHVQPNRAMDPGLVYDLTTEDYLDFLCSLYNSTQLHAFYKKPYACPHKKLSLLDFNYPTITVPSLSRKTIVTRRVKNVGAPATYKVRFCAPQGVSLSVEPEVLTFSKIGEEKVFSVTLTPKSCLCKADYAFGKLLWTDGKHFVRSPIVVKGA